MASTLDIMIQNARQDEAARQARRGRIDREVVRKDGLRVKLTKVPGLTRGDAATVLSTPYFFQCPPLDSYDRPGAFSWNRRTTYKGVEYLERGGRQLKTRTFRTIAVEWASFVVEKDFDVPWLVEALERIRDSGWPFHLLSTFQYGKEGDVLDDMDMVLESFTPGHQAGENDAVYMDLTFVEYPDPIVSSLGKTKRRGEKPFPYTIELRRDGTYHVVGDKKQGTSQQVFDTKDEELTLQVIAQYAYGEPTMWPVIARAQKPPITKWGSTTPLIRHPRFKKGGKILVPKPPEQWAIMGGVLGSHP